MKVCLWYGESNECSCCVYRPGSTAVGRFSMIWVWMKSLGGWSWGFEKTAGAGRDMFRELGIDPLFYHHCTFILSPRIGRKDTFSIRRLDQDPKFCKNLDGSSDSPPSS
jgi:hypothetical protein